MNSLVGTNFRFTEVVSMYLELQNLPGVGRGQRSQGFGGLEKSGLVGSSALGGPSSDSPQIPRGIETLRKVPESVITWELPDF